MTEQEIQDSRDYLYGYYCGHAGLTLGDQPSRATLMGHQDAVGDEENKLVFPHALNFANLCHGFLVGVFEPRKGLQLYFETSNRDDPVAERIYEWNADLFPSSQKPRGWRRVLKSAILHP